MQEFKPKLLSELVFLAECMAQAMNSVVIVALHSTGLTC